MTRKILLACLGFIFTASIVHATPPDEGMWLPLLIKRLNYDEMQKMGCKLTAEEIYSVNNSSVKDAIIQLGGFCTGEVVSDQGLVLTNHHCAYDAIQSQSSVDHDYLTDGFWAKTKSDELPIEGLTVKFLVRMEDVTARVLERAEKAGEVDRDMAIAEEMAKIEEEAAEGNDYTTSVRDMFMGNEYYLFVYEVFRDIRLVGAPPSSVGKFGGDTDNWMWPRHTGDFSMLRIYAGEDNEPADYSASNKPYTPKHSLPVSIKGLNLGDFSMIMGYPGSTDRYLTSYQIDQIYNDKNPDYVKLMEAKLNIMKEEMDADDATRIMLASDYASLANYWKYCLGQNNTLRQRDLQGDKRELEAKFTKWIQEDPKRKAEYGDILSQIEQGIQQSKKQQKLANYMNFAGFGPEMISYGFNFYRLKKTMEASPDKESWKPAIGNAMGAVDEHFEEYSYKTDKRIFSSAVQFMKEDLPAEYQLSVFEGKNFTKKARDKGSIDKYDAYANYVYSNSILTDPERSKAFLENPSLKALEKDPGVEYMLSVVNMLFKLRAESAQVNAAEETLMRKFVKGIREMDPNGKFYPDANSTFRLTYGTIKPYDPRDGVRYEWYTTTDGILEKENPKDDEFYVEPELLELIRKKDFGQYVDKDGSMHVCFLTNHDITGGNSGSPVIDANGNLIGIAFDGNWESMASDLVFDGDVVRTISVDIRYVLFIIDKYANAKHLIDEMKLVKN